MTHEHAEHDKPVRIPEYDEPTQSEREEAASGKTVDGRTPDRGHRPDPKDVERKQRESGQPQH